MPKTALRRLSAVFKGDRDVVLFAVTQHGEALRFASEELNRDGFATSITLKNTFLT